MRWHLLPAQQAISGCGTIIGVTVGTAANIGIQWIRPQGALLYTLAQISMANMYLATLAGRHLFSIGGGIERWHAQFAYNIASSAVPVMLSISMNEIWHLQGFESQTEWHSYIDKYRKQRETDMIVSGDKRITLDEVDKWYTKAFKHQRRNASTYTMAYLTFSFSWWCVIWFVMDAEGAEAWWQPGCEALVKKSESRLMTVMPVVNYSVSLLVIIFLWVQNIQARRLLWEDRVPLPKEQRERTEHYNRYRNNIPKRVRRDARLASGNTHPESLAHLQVDQSCRHHRSRRD